MGVDPVMSCLYIYRFGAQHSNLRHHFSWIPSFEQRQRAVNKKDIEWSCQWQLRSYRSCFFIMKKPKESSQAVEDQLNKSSKWQVTMILMRFQIIKSAKIVILQSWNSFFVFLFNIKALLCVLLLRRPRQSTIESIKD